MTLGEANDNATLVFLLTKGQSSRDFMSVLSQLRQPPGFLAQVMSPLMKMCSIEGSVAKKVLQEKR